MSVKRACCCILVAHVSPMSAGKTSETPKKSSKQGRKPKPDSCDDYCRVCECNFKIEQGNFSSKTSFENIFKPSQRKESKGLILAGALNSLDLVVCQSPGHSERVCRPCGRKIRTAAEIYSFLKGKLTVSDAASLVSSPQRQKRQLPTTITPERSSNKKQAKHNKGTTSRLTASKELFKQRNENDDPNTNTVTDSSELEDEIRNLYNIEPSETKTHTEVRVIIAYPRGEIAVKQSFDKLTSCLLLNIATKEWKTVANVIFKHDEIMEHVPAAVRRKVSNEFQSLSSESILKGTSPEELSAFNNKIFLHEVSVKCPLWFSSINGACAV